MGRCLAYGASFKPFGCHEYVLNLAWRGGTIFGLFAGEDQILRSASDRAAALSKHCGSVGEDLFALLAQLALGPDVCAREF